MMVDEQSIGQQVTCPSCHRKLTVPPQASSVAALPPLTGAGPLAYAAPRMSSGGPIAPPPSDEIRLPTELPPKLRFPGCPTCHLVISTAGADVNADFDASPVMRSFVDNFARALKKKFDVQLTTPSPDAPAMLSFVRVLRLDQGNRWLRYFLALFAGGTTLQIEGHVLAPGGQPDMFTFKHRCRMGLFGGDSLALLKLDAKVLARKVAKRVKKAGK